MIISLQGQVPDVKAAFVAPNATISGNVSVGEGSSIWFNAVLRAEGAAITVGRDVSVQDHVMVHVDVDTPVSIGNGVTIGHNAVVHGCTVEDDVLIGMNSTILNNAHIGKGALVAAGALVPEGMEVPENALVAGVPAKVKKIFTEEQVKSRQAYYVGLYAEEAKAYAEEIGRGI